MTQAEQNTVVSIACDFPLIEPVDSTYDNRTGVWKLYADGSSSRINSSSMIIRNGDGLEVYYSEQLLNP